MNLVERRSIAESKVLALCNLGRLSEALEALRSCQSPASSSTYAHLLQLCVTSNAEEEGKILHDHLLARGYPTNLHLSTKFIIFFAKIGDLVSARKVFDGMPERNVVSWTALVSGYSQKGFWDETLDIFSLMHRGCNKPNQFTYASVLKACTGASCIRIGSQIQGCIEKSRFRQNLFVNSALVDFHLKCGVLEDARNLFWRMEDRDVVLWNSMIGGHAIRGLADDSFRLFISMLKGGKIPDHFTFASILRACGVVKDSSNADKMHSFIIKSGFANHYVVSGSLIDAYVKCRRILSARLLYNSLPEQDIVSSTTLIAGYARDRSYSRDALTLYCKINQTGMKIDNVILCSMLNVSSNEALLELGRQIHARAVKNQSNHDVALHNALVDMYAKSGELKDAILAFDEMRSKNVISWTSLIAGYGKHGKGEEAVKLFKKMENNGIKPNDVTFLSLISACSHSGLTSKGMNFFDLMVNKYAIQPRFEHYSCVVDLLGREGLINEAYNFVKKMNFKPNISIWGTMLGACRIHDNMSLGEVAADVRKLQGRFSSHYMQPWVEKMTVLPEFAQLEEGKYSNSSFLRCATNVTGLSCLSTETKNSTFKEDWLRYASPSKPNVLLDHPLHTVQIQIRRLHHVIDLHPAPSSSLSTSEAPASTLKSSTTKKKLARLSTEAFDPTEEDDPGDCLLDNVLSDYLQVKATQLTSTTVATAGLSVQVPLAAIVDSLTGHPPHLVEYIGAASIMVGFVGINIPSDVCSHSQEMKQVLESENVSLPTELVEFGRTIIP